MKPKVKRRILFIIGLFVSVLPAMTATLLYFPLWQAKGAHAIVSGFALLLLLVSALPLWRFIKRTLSSPAVWSVWLMLFIIFALLSAIADEMKIIAFVGFVSNAAGAVFFKLSYKAEIK